MLENKKIICISIIIILIIILSIFFNNMAKNKKNGNNNISQEIVNDILNISSYECKVEVEIKSNKNSNKYIIKQEYKSSEENLQEILEPSNIKGIKITKQGNNLKIENSKLSLIKIIEDYKQLTQNTLDLATFIEEYKNNENSQFKEEENQIILETILKRENIYQKYEKLYIDKNTGKPIKLEIKDTNQNVIINIIYNEIKIKK